MSDEMVSINLLFADMAGRGIPTPISVAPRPCWHGSSSQPSPATGSNTPRIHGLLIAAFRGVKACIAAI